MDNNNKPKRLIIDFHKRGVNGVRWSYQRRLGITRQSRLTDKASPVYCRSKNVVCDWREGERQ